MSNPVVSWAQENPLVAGVAAIGVIVVVMLVAGGGGGSSTSDNSGSVAAYYAAVGQQTQAGNAVQIAQIQANADTNKTLIAATYGLDTAKVQASVQSQALTNQRAGLDMSYWLGVQTLQSNERVQAATIDANRLVAANTNSANVQIAQHQASASVRQANAANGSTLQDISGLIGSIGNTAKKLIPLF